MRAAIFTTRVAAITFRRRQDTLLGYPLRGIQANGIFSPRVPATYDGTGVAPYGWTRQYARPHRHAVRTEWAVLANGEVQAALGDARANRLTPAERTAVQNAVDGAAELDASWDTATEDDD